MNWFKNTLIIAGLAVAFTACESDVTIDDFSQGEADFTSYVAIGNSLTAGYISGDVPRSGQIASYPNIISSSMNVVGGSSSFIQPLFQDEAGLGQGLALGFGADCVGTVGLAVVPAGLAPNPTVDGTAPFNNMGVPGIRSFEVFIDGYGSLNPYFGRFQNGPTSNVVGDALAAQPTFFTVWLGNNDVLGFATSGGVAGNTPCVPTATNPCLGSITDPSVVEQSIAGTLQALTLNGAKGVIANIPNVTDIPFFTTVPAQLFPLDEANAANLTGAFTAVAGIVTQNLALGGVPLAQAEAIASQYAIEWTEGANYPIVAVEATQTNPLGWRQMTAGELLVLTTDTDAVRCQGYGTMVLTPDVLQTLGLLAMGGTPTPAEAAAVVAAVSPIADGDTLLADELAAIQSATSAYNSSIASLANQFGLGVADMNGFFSEVTANSGITFSGATYSPTFVTGGLFSLDGVHPTSRGYSIIANKFMETINETYGSNLPMVDPNEFEGLAVPNTP
ncbi:MAG: hypothetical protein KTR13_01475 [Saprospiraceae bacterium]|nr:hypothetical protein [Saprospiraceae bacterium]